MLCNSKRDAAKISPREKRGRNETRIHGIREKVEDTWWRTVFSLFASKTKAKVNRSRRDCGTIDRRCLYAMVDRIFLTRLPPSYYFDKYDECTPNNIFAAIPPLLFEGRRSLRVSFQLSRCFLFLLRRNLDNVASSFTQWTKNQLIHR